MRPTCLITVDGKPASGLFMSRLVSCTVTDEAGISADRVVIELTDNPPAAIPRVGAILNIRMGYGAALSDMGEFVAQDIETAMVPYLMRITGKSADLGGTTTDQRERHWDDTTLGQVVEDIAKRNGLKAAVDPSLASFAYSWLGQVSESDVAFLERLARTHGALFAIKAGTIIFAVRGSGLSPLGSALTQLVITKANLQPGTGRVTRSERAKFADVVATWMDRAAGKRREVKVPATPGAEGTFTLDQPFGSEAEATAAAKAKVAELARHELTFSATIVGDPAARGGAPCTFQGVRPGNDGVPLIIETATHSFGKAGYTTALVGTGKP